jgi:hypothetical protein
MEEQNHAGSCEDQDLPMCLWAEAAMTIVYVQNRLPHSTLGLKTPEEMFTGKKLEVSHLKIFGLSSVYSYTEREKKQAGTLQKEGNICGISVRYPRPSEYTYLVTIILRSSGM